jgi:hypothetical protein
VSYAPPDTPVTVEAAAVDTAVEPTAVAPAAVEVAAPAPIEPPIVSESETAAEPVSSEPPVPPAPVTLPTTVTSPSEDEKADTPASWPPKAEAQISADVENPLAATNSPWTSSENMEDVSPPPEVLPSAQVSKQPPAPTPATASVPEEGGSRGAMTLLLGVAVLALIGAVVYFTVIDKRPTKSDDPAQVDVGSEQRDYDAEPKPSATPSAPAPEPSEVPKPAPPPPTVVLPKIAPPTVPKPSRRKSAEDIYDGL